LKKQREISDEEFMAEFEVSDEQYRIGLVLPGFSDKRSIEE
jgi:HSP20 family molecular chaperone IbpA